MRLDSRPRWVRPPPARECEFRVASVRNGGPARVSGGLGRSRRRLRDANRPSVLSFASNRAVASRGVVYLFVPVFERKKNSNATGAILSITPSDGT